MLNDKEAKEAIDNLNGTEIKGRAVNVNQAREKENNSGERRNSDQDPKFLMHNTDGITRSVCVYEKNNLVCFRAYQVKLFRGVWFKS